MKFNQITWIVNNERILNFITKLAGIKQDGDGINAPPQETGHAILRPKCGILWGENSVEGDLNAGIRDEPLPVVCVLLESRFISTSQAPTDVCDSPN